MQISDAGIELLKELEGCSSLAYSDSGGALTIGIGHLLTKSERTSGKIKVPGYQPFRIKDGLEEWEIEAILREDLRVAEWAITKLVKVELSQNQHDALVCFIFNVGNQAFAGSTLLKLLNKGQYDQVPEQMRRWVYDNGVRISGLVNRREKEIALWERP